MLSCPLAKPIFPPPSATIACSRHGCLHYTWVNKIQQSAYLDNQFDPAKNTLLFSSIFSSIFSSPNGLYWDLNSVPCPPSPNHHFLATFHYPAAICIHHYASSRLVRHQNKPLQKCLQRMKLCGAAVKASHSLESRAMQPSGVSDFWSVKEAFFPLSPCIPLPAGDCQLCRLSYTWAPGLTEVTTGISHMSCFSYPAASQKLNWNSKGKTLFQE